MMEKLQQRIKKHAVVSESGCWLWTGAKKPNGYGNIWGGKSWGCVNG